MSDRPITKRFEAEAIPSGRGVGLDTHYITDAKRRVGLKPGIIAKTHSATNAAIIVNALNYAAGRGQLDGEIISFEVHDGEGA